MQTAVNWPIMNCLAFFGWIDPKLSEETPERVWKCLLSRRNEVAAAGTPAPFRPALF
jgi:hypothetical protein